MRTSRADQNYCSISAGVVEWFAGTDQARGGELPDPLSLLPEKPQNWDAIFKICDGTRDRSYVADVAQGRENAVDPNNQVEQVTVSGRFGATGGVGDQVITTKGGCKNCTFSGPVLSEGRNAHVVVGAWSDQCFDISEDLDYSGLLLASGGPLTFILARCRNVKLPPRAKILRWKSLGYSLYWWGKWAYVKIVRPK